MGKGVYTFGCQEHSVKCDTVEGKSVTESSTCISQQHPSTFIVVSANEGSLVMILCSTHAFQWRKSTQLHLH